MKRVLVFDPIDFNGGSKIATCNMLRYLPDTYELIILTTHAEHWIPVDVRAGVSRFVYLWQWARLKSAETGIQYFVRHFLLALQIILLQFRFGKCDVSIGASGPGVDLALYIAKLFGGGSLIQLVHGPVYAGRTIARALMKADAVHYLPSAEHSIVQALSLFLTRDEIHVLLKSGKFGTILNGIPADSWPPPCQYDPTGVFWAASLLKWKGLSILVEALKKISPPPRTCICYIKPKGTQHEVDNAPQNVAHVQWYEEPPNLDELRAQHNIFVSTSLNEPFGLSILEAMAAGLCPVIPHDSSWWDMQLTDGYDCLKYAYGDSDALASCLRRLISNPHEIERMGKQAQILAQKYQAETCYQPLLDHIAQLATS